WWRDGASLSSIARGLGAPVQHVRRFLGQTGGVRESPTQRASQHLSTGEREEISRGLAAGQSVRAIAGWLGRACSTIAREVAGNGGRERYRAQEAETATEQRRRRPKSTALEQNQQLRRLVHEKLTQRWSPQQIT